MTQVRQVQYGTKHWDNTPRRAMADAPGRSSARNASSGREQCGRRRCRRSGAMAHGFGSGRAAGGGRGPGGAQGGAGGSAPAPWQ